MNLSPLKKTSFTDLNNDHHTSSPARLHKIEYTKPDAKANRCTIHIAAFSAATSVMDCVNN